MKKIKLPQGGIGIGRRKKALCRVLVTSGTGQITINRKNHVDYMQHKKTLITKVEAPLTHLDSSTKFNACIYVSGGGLVGQADAILLGLSRALCDFNVDYRYPLRAKGYLTQDSRIKERKKYGLKKARKSPQFSKR